MTRDARWGRVEETIGEDPYLVGSVGTAYVRGGARSVMEPGEIGVAIGGALDRLPLQGSFTLAGPERTAGAGRVLDTPVLVSDG